MAQPMRRECDHDPFRSSTAWSTESASTCTVVDSQARLIFTYASSRPPPSSKAWARRTVAP